MHDDIRTIARARPLGALSAPRVLAALLLCAALTACGGSDDNPPPANGGSPAQPEQPSAKPQMKCAP